MVDRVGGNHYLHDSILLRPGDTVVDVGAHVGAFAISIAKAHPWVPVYAIEADRSNYRHLLRNIRINGLQNVVPIRAAIAARGHRARIFTRSGDGTCVTLSPQVAAEYEEIRSARVPAITLDELFAKHDITACRLLRVSS